MYVCPICGREFERDDSVAKHFLQCWRDKNPNHKSKDAPRSDDVVVSEVSNDISDFFNSWGGVNG